MNIMNIQQIEQHRIIGNAHSDQPLMNAIDAFIADDTNPMNERIRACIKLDQVMGIECVVTEADVHDYMANR